MKISCQIIQDLLPLFHDEVCSEDSRKLIQEHLQTCHQCKAFYNELKDDFIKDDVTKIKEVEQAKLFKGVKREMVKKNIKVSLVSILGVVFILLGAVGVVFFHQSPMTYEEGIFVTQEAYDGPIDIIFNEGDFHRARALRRPIEVGGTTKEIVFIYFTETIWTRHFSRPDAAQVTMGNSMIMDFRNEVQLEGFSDNEIIAVYYLIGDLEALRYLNDEEFNVATQDAILLWER